MMAVLFTDQNKYIKVKPEQAKVIWQILNGEIQGTEQQQKYCLHVKSVYLNRYSKNTPKSYKDYLNSIDKRK